MEIILYLPETIGEAVSLFITQYLKLPKPVICNISELQELYTKLAPAVLVTNMSIIKNKDLDRKLAQATKIEGIDSRTIVLSDKPFASIEESKVRVDDTEIAEKFEHALEHSFDSRIATNLLCLVGITYAEFHEREMMDKEQPMIGIKRIRKEEVMPGRWYLVIDKSLKQALRRLYPSDKNDHFRMEIDKYLTPHQYFKYSAPDEISFMEIEGLFYITHQVISF